MADQASADERLKAAQEELSELARAAQDELSRKPNLPLHQRRYIKGAADAWLHAIEVLRRAGPG